MARRVLPLGRKVADLVEQYGISEVVRALADHAEAVVREPSRGPKAERAQYQRAADALLGAARVMFLDEEDEEEGIVRAVAAKASAKKGAGA